MIVSSLHITGFGRFSGRRYDFAPGLNVVFGPNESGKSTLVNAIVATLYGAERKKDMWRPWSGGAFATTLVYRLSNGEQIEVQRDFDRDSKGLHVYDRSGNEISAKLGSTKIVPGEAHLGVPLDVFLNAACVKQQAVAIDEGKSAGPLATHLARALDGGPREDAALGAIGRLDEALRTHVGTDRARKNTPLRNLRIRAEAQRVSVAESRSALASLDELRDRLEGAVHERERLAAAIAEIERRRRSLRAGEIGKRLANLHEFRAELAELQSHRGEYDDVQTFPPDGESELEAAYFGWNAARPTAAAAQADAEAASLTAEERAELERLLKGVGSIDQATFDALSAADERAFGARAAASAAGRDAVAARPAHTDGGTRNTVAIAGLVALCVAIGFAIAHTWTWTAAAFAVAAACLGVAYTRERERMQRRRAALDKQRLADNALREETTAANAVKAVLETLGIARFDELVARRTRLTELLSRQREAERRNERARAARIAVGTAAAAFDQIAQRLVPDVGGSRLERKAAGNARAARRRERDGIGAHLHALEMQKSAILGSDDEFALEAELAELLRAGVEPSEHDGAGASRGAEREWLATTEALRAARDTCARLSGELAVGESHITDLAALEEQLVRTQTDIARLEAFERCVNLAKGVLEQRTREAHQAFARRLEDYAAATLGGITAGRYAEIFVDAGTLAVHVRVPETGAIVDLDGVSAGTRDQIYLVVRFAMARMFAEGIETPPLLLDDPFAYWDATRIDRCLPIVELVARDAQAIIFTSSSELADAAARRGAYRINLPEPAPREPGPAQAQRSSVSSVLGDSARSTAMRI